MQAFGDNAICLHRIDRKLHFFWLQDLLFQVGVCKRAHIVWLHMPSWSMTNGDHGRVSATRGIFLMFSCIIRLLEGAGYKVTWNNLCLKKTTTTRKQRLLERFGEAICLYGMLSRRRIVCAWLSQSWHNIFLFGKGIKEHKGTKSIWHKWSGTWIKMASA